MKSAIYPFIILLLAFQLSGISQIKAQTTDPGLIGTHIVIKAEYNLGNTSYIPPAAALFPSPMEEIGSVHYPADLTSGTFPVLFWLHGRHETCYDTSNTSNTDAVWPCPAGWKPITSYEGYDYAAKTMASHGYIVISISANAINAIDGTLPAADHDGMDARGVLVQHHMDLWNGWNSTDTTGPFGHLFVGRLNMKNIGTMGHSRGGEGVVFNAEYNRSLGSPYGIKALLTLAPVDFYRHVLNGIPLLDIAPYCDGDVNDLEGVHFYDDARYRDTTDVMPKHTILVMGANHNFFNTVWTPGSYIAGGYDDWLYTGNDTSAYCGALAAGTGRLDTTTQKAVFNAYAAAFYRLYLGHETIFAPMLEVNNIVPPASSLMDSLKIFVSYHPGQHDRLDINTMDTVTNIIMNTIGGSVNDTSMVAPEICGGGLALPVCDGGLGSAQKPHRGNITTKGLGQMKLTWSDTTDFYENNIPAAFENFTDYQNLTFRACENFMETTSIPGLNFTVELIDSAGSIGRQVVGNYTHALFLQPGSTVSDLPKEVFNTIHIPILAFTGINLKKVRHIRFNFNKSDSGAILLSDLALSNPVCGNLNAVYTDSIGKRYKVYFTNSTLSTIGDSLTYLWNFGDVSSGPSDTSTMRNPTHTYHANGSFTACLYVKDYRKNGFVCTDTFCTSIVLANDAVPELNRNEISIYPNPAKNMLLVTGADKTDVITLVNVFGQVVLRQTINANSILLPESIPSGIYTVIVTTGFGRVVQKLVIER